MRKTDVELFALQAKNKKIGGSFCLAVFYHRRKKCIFVGRFRIFLKENFLFSSLLFYSLIDSRMLLFEVRYGYLLLVLLTKIPPVSCPLPMPTILLLGRGIIAVE